MFTTPSPGSALLSITDNTRHLVARHRNYTVLDINCVSVEPALIYRTFLTEKKRFPAGSSAVKGCAAVGIMERWDGGVMGCITAHSAFCPVAKFAVSSSSSWFSSLSR